MPPGQRLLEGKNELSGRTPTCYEDDQANRYKTMFDIDDNMMVMIMIMIYII